MGITTPMHALPPKLPPQAVALSPSFVLANPSIHQLCYYVPDTDEGDEGWYLFNDSLVQRSAYASFSAISSKFSSDVPYVLFYARRQAADLSDGTRSLCPIQGKWWLTLL